MRAEPGNLHAPPPPRVPPFLRSESLYRAITLPRRPGEAGDLHGGRGRAARECFGHSLIVPGTKTVHHILPDLVPPMDRDWTGAFFLWSAAAPQYAQETTFTRTFTGLTQIARDVQLTGYTGGGWRTSTSKVLDNAIIGYCRLSQIPPAQT